MSVTSTASLPQAVSDARPYSAAVDFSFSEVQEELRGLARTILDGHVTLDRLKAVEATDDGVDHDLWKDLAAANLLGVALAEDVGGSGYGIAELAVVLVEAGRRVAPVPLVATIGMAALAIDRFGSPALRAATLPDVVSGEQILTAALEDAASRDPLRPSTTATADGDGWRL